MAPSRTIGDQAFLERTEDGRESEMDFSSGSEVTHDDVSTGVRTSKTVDVDILRDTIGHPSQKLLSFEFA